MRSGKRFSFLSAMVMILVVSVSAAQDAAPGPGQYKTKILPPIQPIPSPFAVNAPASRRLNAIAFLEPVAMTAADREQVGNAGPAIQSKAAIQGFNLREGTWNFQQIACPVMPGEILLLYTQDNGVGDVSKFSAAIPRDGNGSILILPIVRRGYSLYTPARVSPMAIAAFNVLRERERLDRKVDWLATGLCYAALAGAHVRLLPTKSEAKRLPVTLALDSVLELETDGGAVVRFFDVQNSQHINEWELTFDKQATLTDVAVRPVPGYSATLLP